MGGGVGGHEGAWVGGCGGTRVHGCGSALVHEFGSNDQKERYLPKLATGEAIRLIREQVQQVASAARQIALSADQQRLGVGQIATAMESINRGAAQSQTGTRQVEEAARDLDRQALALRKVVETYKVG